MNFLQMYQKAVIFLAGLFSSIFLGILFFSNSFSIDLSQWKKVQIQIGSKDAQVEVVLFEDILCEECKNFYLHTFPLIKKKYIDTGKINFIWVPIEALGNSDIVINELLCLFKINPSYPFLFLNDFFLFSDEDQEIKVKNSLKNLYQSLNLPFQLCKIDLNPQDFLKKNFQAAKKMMPHEVEVPTIFIQGKKLENVGYFSISKEIEKYLYQKEPN